MMCDSMSVNTNKNNKYDRSQLWSTLRSTLFVVGTAVIIFAAACNTITWHLQRFWGASGDFWQRQWDKVYYKFDGDEFYIFVIGTTILAFSIYWGVGIIYTIMDITGQPAAIMKYRIQPDKMEPIEHKRLIKVILHVIFNQLLGIPVIVAVYHLMEFRGFNRGIKLPTFQWVLLELVVFVIFEEVGFYYFHRLLHHPRVYKRIHKKHHEWISPIAITAIYCHPIEHILSNLLPPLLGPLVMGSHTATYWLWFTVVILSTLNAHSGYHFPFFPSPEAHDFHHLKFNQNYGMLGLLDRLHGTDTMFRSSKAYHRHIMLLSLVPMRQLIPDEPKEKTS
uniref:Fatty acid hydroxylase domain-containing protein n=1 Tax=Strigamia maritima TaxID=126957 RepID=T1JK58_STRMM